MLIARFIGRGFVIAASIVAAIAGIVLIVLGATATPTNTGFIVGGVVAIVAAALFILDAVTDPTRGHRVEIGGPDS